MVAGASVLPGQWLFNHGKSETLKKRCLFHTWTRLELLSAGNVEKEEFKYECGKKRETIKNFENFEEQKPQKEVKKRSKSRGEVRKG